MGGETADLEGGSGPADSNSGTDGGNDTNPGSDTKTYMYALANNNTCSGACDDGEGADQQNQVPSGIDSKLTKAASDFGVPLDVVLAVVKTESSFNPNLTHENKDGSTDYGLFQVNSKNIGGTTTGPDGKSFKIGENIKTNIDANITAGLSLLAKAYNAAAQGGGGAQRVAQETYSRYNGGPRAADRYTRIGVTTGKRSQRQDIRDIHFINNYMIFHP